MVSILGCVAVEKSQENDTVHPHLRHSYYLAESVCSHLTVILKRKFPRVVDTQLPRKERISHKMV